MLIKVVENPTRFKHHMHIIKKLIKANLIMPNLETSDRGGLIVRDSEEHAIEMNKIIRNIIRKG
jgi:hypothetical protein